MLSCYHSLILLFAETVSLDKGIPTDTVAPAEDDVPLAETIQIIDTLPTEREAAVEVVPMEGEVPAAAAATVLLHPLRKKLLLWLFLWKKRFLLLLLCLQRKKFLLSLAILRNSKSRILPRILLLNSD
ncbi:hypothetical protein CMV_007713 [Castanea mollissima]|uniref:Secreted protein n=1 Tax=Castanea mollissima TaxID=60419 RepID=A0A8J4RHL6_9ROSI|nr:hypothetical protein CMV_007713 [Castanea mollissima]